MRPLSTTLLLLCCLVCNAQDWALINPAYRYNYANDGTDTISNQIRVMEAETWGAGGFRYKLNPIAELCAPCTDAPPSCEQQEGLIKDRPQFLGLSATVSGTEWTLFGTDTLLIRSAAALGATWMDASGIQATVIAASEMDILGQPDSVKLIEYSNGVSLTLSKDHGIVLFAAGGATHALIGVQGDSNEGERFPVVIDIFDYAVGDVLQYRGNDFSTDGFCVYNTTYTRKYEVLSRTDQPMRTDYVLRLVQHHYTTAVPTSGSSGCSGGSGSSETVVALGVDHDRWTGDNFLGSAWLNQLWPQAFAEPLISGEFAGEFASNYNGSQWRAYLDEAGRYVLEPAALGTDQFLQWRTVNVCDGDTSYWPLAFDRIIGRYVEGIGFTYGKYLGFEHSSEKILEAYLIGGVEYGTLTPDDIILNVATSAALSKPSLVFPNPANEELTLSQIGSTTTYRIIDTQGRAVLTGTLMPSQRIDIRSLSTGSYQLLRTGFAPERFMIVR